MGGSDAFTPVKRGSERESNPLAQARTRHKNNIHTGRAMLTGGLELKCYDEAAGAKGDKFFVQFETKKGSKTLSQDAMYQEESLRNLHVSLVFTSRRKEGSIFSRRSRVTIHTIQLDEISQIIPGPPKTGNLVAQTKGVDPDLLVTLITTATDEQPRRMVCLVFNISDVRDCVVSCLRHLCHPSAHATQGLGGSAAVLSPASSGAGAATPTPTTAPQTPGGPAGGGAVSSVEAEALRKQLAEERQNNANLLAQFLEANNDYNDKLEQSKVLAKEVQQLRIQLESKDSMFKEDTKTRFKLSKKLESVVNDNSELRRRLADMETKYAEQEEMLLKMKKVMSTLAT